METKSTFYQAPASYSDGRPATTVRINAVDSGLFLHHGTGPNRCDYLGMREAICFKAGDTYYLHYDGGGPTGWLVCLAVSKDLRQWDLKGPVLSLGAPGDKDSATACSGWTIFDGEWWHMFYVGAEAATPPPDLVPTPPYYTLQAKSRHPYGPWIQERVVPFTTKPGTYYSEGASAGHVIKHGDEYLMFFSAARDSAEDGFQRTLSIARAPSLDGPWQVDADPILPLAQQIENSALYFEPANQTWFLFTNHVGLDDQRREYTESIWVYWSKDPNKWDAEKRAVVLDRENCRWSARCIGMPSVVKTDKGLALFYDATAPGTAEADTANLGRDLGLAWLELPLRPPF